MPIHKSPLDLFHAHFDKLDLPRLDDTKAIEYLQDAETETEVEEAYNDYIEVLKDSRDYMETYDDMCRQVSSGRW